MLSSSGDSDMNCTFKDANKTIQLFADQKNIWAINCVFKLADLFCFLLCLLTRTKCRGMSCTLVEAVKLFLL